MSVLLFLSPRGDFGGVIFAAFFAFFKIQIFG
jgi:hypothetical protein